MNMRNTTCIAIKNSKVPSRVALLLIFYSVVWFCTGYDQSDRVFHCGYIQSHSYLLFFIVNGAVIFYILAVKFIVKGPVLQVKKIKSLKKLKKVKIDCHSMILIYHQNSLIAG